MATQIADWRAIDRRVYAAVALMFPLIVLIGFGRTYYLKLAFGTAPLPSPLVHLHGALMTLWVGFFISQVWLIRSKRHRVHMTMGWVGVGLAILIIIVGFLTATAAAVHGSPSTPPGFPPLAFLAVPIFDIALFALFFAGAIWYRKRPADHKRLLLLTVLNFLPPSLGRFPIAALQSLGPLFFFGFPTVLAIALIIYDTRAHGRLNKPLLIGSIILIASYPLRLMLAGTGAWMTFAAWLTSWSVW